MEILLTAIHGIESKKLSATDTLLQPTPSALNKAATYVIGKVVEGEVENRTHLILGLYNGVAGALDYINDKQPDITFIAVSESARTTNSRDMTILHELLKNQKLRHCIVFTDDDGKMLTIKEYNENGLLTTHADLS